MATFLQLAAEQGGTRFGPFPHGVIQLGSDPHRCQIVLNAALGIFAVHCLVQDAGNGTYSVMPTQANLKLWLIQAGQGASQQITGACKAKAGDSIVLGSETGPRFTIVWDGVDARTPTGGTASTATGAGFGGRVAQEASRRSRAQLLAKNPVARQLYLLKTRYGNGRWKSPYILVGIGFAVLSLLGTGAVGCSGAALAIWRQFLSGM